MNPLTRWAALALMLLLAAACPVRAQDDPATAPAAQADDDDPLSMLAKELRRLNEEIGRLRSKLAAAKLEATAARRELEELRQFMADHHQFGQDFQHYTAVKAAAEQAALAQQQEIARQRREMERAERAERRRRARAANDQEREALDRVAYYQQRGFSPLGLDVFLSKVAYQYHSVDDVNARFDYAPGFGRYLRFHHPRQRVDFSSMTISGSVVNGSEEVRNVGVAITFFDETGHQVGHEIVQIRNARPDVPYPFTSTVEMALDRPFATSSQYVLYQDLAVEEEAEN